MEIKKRTARDLEIGLHMKRRTTVRSGVLSLLMPIVLRSHCRILLYSYISGKYEQLLPRAKLNKYFYTAIYFIL